MGFCSKLSVCLLAGLGVAQGASFVKSTVVNPRVRSVVRADNRTGRLVRTVVVSPKIIQPVALSPDQGGPPATASNASVPELVEAAARKYDIDPLLVHSVIQVESSYNPYAISPKGAQGLMQLMPGTARRFGVANTFDPQDNIEGGVRYLKYLQDLFPHDVRLAIAAYNAGEGAVWKYNNQIPPYRETEEYVVKVGRKWGQARKAAEQQKKIASQPAGAAAVPPSEPVSAPVESYVDSEGRLYLRNVSTP